MAALPLIVFDVNETLLDLETMEPTFQRIFGEKSAMRLWFANLIMYSAALTVAGCYVPFTDIGAAVMEMLANTRGIKIADKDKKELTEKFSTMPPHPEVPAALRKLRDAGFRLFTLTDNLLEVQTRQLEHGGIVDLFERRFSADGVKHHKPSRAAYAYVERELAVELSRLCLIACHTWDTLGAVAAGWEAALIKRVGNDVLGVGPQPQIVGDDLNDVANQLIARHKGRAYGTIDAGFGYQIHGAPLDPRSPPGASYLVQKTNRGSRWYLAPNGLSNSLIGIKGSEPIGWNTSVVFALDAGFDPYSLKLSSGPGSAAHNAGVP